MRKFLASAMSLLLALCMTIGQVSAIESEDLEVTSIVANTYVGDGQREVSSFEITVNDISLISDLTADDFEIKNNISSIQWDAEGNSYEYEDDGISIEIVGNTIVMSVTPFDYTGMYNADWSKSGWEVICNKYEVLSFTADDVTDLKTQTLDEAQIITETRAGLTRTYALYLPTNEDGSYKTNVPIVVWNHGGGEYAGDIMDTLVANRGFTAWNEEGYECAVLVLQVSNANYSYGASFDESKKSLIDQNNAFQASVIEDLIIDGIVDSSRVYVTGASSGGGATMRFLMQYPDLVAGAIAMCSMDPIVWVHYNYQDSYETIVSNFEEAFQGQVYTWSEEEQAMVTKDVDTEALINTPIYFVHAENDSTCSVTSSKAMYEALSNLGATDNEIMIFSNEDMAEEGIYYSAVYHWSWVRVLNHPEEGMPMNWLFQQQKSTTSEAEDIDKTELETLVESISDITNTDNKYTDTSYNAYLEALETANKVLSDESATQEEVDNALAALQEAYAALTEVTSSGSDSDPTNTDTNTGTSTTTTGTSTSTVKTGDSTNIVIPILCMIGAAGIYFFVRKRKTIK